MRVPTTKKRMHVRTVHVGVSRFGGGAVTMQVRLEEETWIVQKYLHEFLHLRYVSKMMGRLYGDVFDRIMDAIVEDADVRVIEDLTGTIDKMVNETLATPDRDIRKLLHVDVYDVAAINALSFGTMIPGNHEAAERVQSTIPRVVQLMTSSPYLRAFGRLLDTIGCDTGCVSPYEILIRMITNCHPLVCLQRQGCHTNLLSSNMVLGGAEDHAVWRTHIYISPLFLSGVLADTYWDVIAVALEFAFAHEIMGHHVVSAAPYDTSVRSTLRNLSTDQCAGVTVDHDAIGGEVGLMYCVEDGDDGRYTTLMLGFKSATDSTIYEIRSEWIDEYLSIDSDRHELHAVLDNLQQNLVPLPDNASITWANDHRRRCAQRYLHRP
ncbi:unnamed protein product (mitochondrion) [Plasmodiophora brassicae]|uniref:Uncharacterized protein n=1 Tax=Plasmodiophora brassicae TaxID=37360 RepID=A0A3P3Y4R9_PLABS|nr:unnamed protein product [Plasmodiophora brassicae]